MPWVSTHAVRTVFAITQLEVIAADAELVSVETEGRVLVGFSFSHLTEIFQKQYTKHTFNCYKKFLHWQISTNAVLEHTTVMPTLIASTQEDFSYVHAKLVFKEMVLTV